MDTIAYFEGIVGHAAWSRQERNPIFKPPQTTSWRAHTASGSAEAPTKNHEQMQKQAQAAMPGGDDPVNKWMGPSDDILGSTCHTCHAVAVAYEWG